MLNVFISGIESKSGKTLVVAGLTATLQSLSYSTSVYKPIQLGVKEVDGKKISPDFEFIKSIDSNINTVSSFMLSDTLNPIVSAYKEKIHIEPQEIFNSFQSLMNLTECNVVEGCNSISSLVAENLTEADIVKGLRLPMVLVVNPTKTPLDRFIPFLNYINSKKVQFLGVIVNQYNENSDNLEHKYFPQILKEILGVKVLGVLPDYIDIQTLPPEILIADILTKFDLEQIFRTRIAKLND
jgi:dethiobiotin synthetase